MTFLIKERCAETYLNTLVDGFRLDRRFSSQWLDEGRCTPRAQGSVITFLHQG